MKVPCVSVVVWTAPSGERWYFAGYDRAAPADDHYPPHQGGTVLWTRLVASAASYPSRRQAIAARAELLYALDLPPNNDLKARRRYRVEPA